MFTKGCKLGVPPNSHRLLDIYPDMTVWEGMWWAKKEGVNSLQTKFKIGACALCYQIKMAPHVSNLVRHVLTAGKALFGRIRGSCTVDFIELSPTKIEGRS